MSGDFSRECMLTKEYLRVLHEQEVYWLQRSRIAWIHAGDRNTKFSHHKVSARHHSNIIYGIFNENGMWCFSLLDIPLTLFQYFSNLFIEKPTFFMNWLDFPVKVLLESFIERLCKLPDEVEIYQAIQDMAAWKSPRPDGVPAGFFSKIPSYYQKGSC